MQERSIRIGKQIVRALVASAQFVRSFFHDKPYARLALVFGFFFLLLFLLYFPSSTVSAADDHFFHFRFAEQLRLHGFLETFATQKALYFTKMAQGGTYYPYYNFLFYLAIIPFTYFDFLYLGIKLYAVIAASLVFTGMYAALRAYRVPYAFLWVAGLFALTSPDVIWRMLLSRPYVLAPMILLALLIALNKRRYFYAAAISFLYVYWYDATFFFPAGIALAYLFVEGLYVNRLEWRGILAPLAGIGLAVASFYLFAPGFLIFVHDIVFGAVSAVYAHTPLPEGAELYPIDLFEYARANALLFAALVTGLVAEGYAYIAWRRGGRTPDEEYSKAAAMRGALLFIIFGCLAGAAVVTGRFKDYIYPMLGVYLVFAARELFRHIRVEAAAGRMLKGALGIALAYLFIGNVIAVNSFLAANAAPVELFAGVGGWLAAHTPPGTIVFNADWGWFPQLYYYAPDDDYVIGLDPKFLYAYSPDLFWLWGNISRYGIACTAEDCTAALTLRTEALKKTATADSWYEAQGDAVARALVNDFNTRYVVSSYQYSNLNDVLDHSSKFKKVYGGDRTYYVYEVERQS